MASGTSTSLSAGASNTTVTKTVMSAPTTTTSAGWFVAFSGFGGNGLSTWSESRSEVMAICVPRVAATNAKV